jgi:hypothetical protein
MTATEDSCPNYAEFEQKIKDGIARRTRVGIQRLAVTVTGDRIVISGRVPSYYLKQLVLQGALDVVRSASAFAFEFNVQVVTGPGEPAIKPAGPVSSPG